MRSAWVSDMSETFGDWLQYHYLSALLVACIALAVLVAIADGRFNPKRALSAESGASMGFAAPLTRNAVFLLLGIGLGLYFWLMLAWEDFTFYDAHIFFQSLAGGPQYAPLQLFPSLGLLRPLSHQEFYPLSFLGNSAQVYQAFAAVEIVLAGYFLTRVYRVHRAITIAICIAILLTPPIVSAAFHIVNSERNILVLLCLFLWAALRYQQSRRTGFLVVASLASFVILQYKETAVVMMMAWACYLLAAARLMKDLASADRRCFTLLAGAVIAGCAIWLAVYGIAILPQIGRSYLVGREHNPFEVLYVIVSHVWYAVLVGSILCRLLLARRGVQISPIWDGLPVAAIASTAAYVKLGFFHDYYYSPAALLSWLYAGRIAELAYVKTMGDRRLALVSVLAIIGVLAAFQVGTSFWGVYAPWKENVASKADAARFIARFHDDRPADARRRPLRVVFPMNTSYEVAYFIGYLQARFRVMDLEAGVGVVRRDKLEAETTQCVLWVPVICTYGLPVRHGDLVAFFGEQGKDLNKLMQEYRLVHVSPEIGFWPNDLRAYVFLAP
jgi:hypothetical protein